MAWYFYVENGKAKGPVNYDEIAAAVRQGLIGPFDLVFVEGEEKWRPLKEYKEFQGILTAKDESIPELQEMWVVLQRSPTKKSYRQFGPFPVERVKSLLKAGKVDYRDHIWKEGMDEWVRISEIETFRPPTRKVKLENVDEVTFDDDHKFDSDSAEEPRQDNYEEEDYSDWEKTEITRIHQPKKRKNTSSSLSSATPPKIYSDEERKIVQNAPPLEYSAQRTDIPILPDDIGQDSNQGSKKQKESKSKAAKTSNATESTTLLDDEGFTELNEANREKSLRLWLLNLSFVILIAGMASVLFYLRVQKPESVEGGEAAQSFAPTPAPVVPPPPSAPKPAQPRLTQRTQPHPLPKVPPPQAVKATSLKIKEEQGKLRFVSDAPPEAVIRVTVQSQIGNSLNEFGAYKVLSLKPGQQLNIASLAHENDQYFRSGEYLVTAKIDDLFAEKFVFVGVKDSRYKSQLNRHRKMIAFRHQRLRRELFAASSQFERLIRDFVIQANKRRSNQKDWAGFYSSWSKNFQVWRGKYFSQTKALEKGFPQHSVKLKNLWDSALSKTDEVHQRILKAQSLSSAGLREEIKEAEKIKKYAGAASLF